MGIGIDYGMGMSNIDRATWIRYGAISQHTVSGDVLNDMEATYAGPFCPRCGGDAVELTEDMDDWPLDGYGCRDYACESCQQVFDSSYCFSEESSGLEYNSGGYEIIDCLDSGLMVLKSPFYTFAQFCSPCVPGAGNLDNPVEGGVRTYCLGHDWFDGGQAPYPVFRVIGDEEVIADEEKALVA